MNDQEMARALGQAAEIIEAVSGQLLAAAGESTTNPGILRKDGTYYILSNAEIQSLKDENPYVDVDQEIRNAAAWCKSQPDYKRKQQIMRFLRRWMTKAPKSDMIINSSVDAYAGLRAKGDS
jgi:hypothetical protein